MTARVLPSPVHHLDSGSDLLIKAAIAIANGEAAVTIFFVLSGAVLFASLQRQPAPLPFVVRRLFRIYPALVAAIALALPLAVAITRSPLLSRIVMPWLVVIQSTPIVAIAPIIVVSLGAGLLPRVVITTLIAFFPLVVSTALGLASVPAELVELSRSLRATTGRQYWQIRLPFAIPYIFSALKVSITLAIVGAVVAEFVAAEKGLGYLILFATSSFKVPVAFASLILLVLCSLALYAAVQLVYKRFFPWSQVSAA